MRYAYLDTEFTSLNRYAAKLISLALVVQDGPEFYVELTDNWNESDCSDFVCGIVLPQLDLSTYGRTTEQARIELGEFLQGLGDVKIASDAPSWDWPMLLNLAGPAGLPANVHAEPFDLNLLDMDDIDTPNEPPHHALLDARLLAQWDSTCRPCWMTNVIVISVTFVTDERVFLVETPSPQSRPRRGISQVAQVLLLLFAFYPAGFAVHWFT